MDAKSLTILEFPLIAQMLAKEAGSGLGVELCLGLSPAPDAHEASVRQAETAAALAAVETLGVPPLENLVSLEEWLLTAERGGTLDASPIHQVLATLTALNQLCSYFSFPEARQEPLQPYYSQLVPLPALATYLAKTFDAEGNVADDASEALAAVRSRIRITRRRAYERAEAAAESLYAQGLLQERLVTFREGRLCVPVRAERLREFRGIAHTTSSSGATVFAEPEDLVPLGNELRQLEEEEAREVARVLAERTSAIAEQAEVIRCNVQAAAQLDAICARAQLAQKMRATRPQLVEESRLYLRAARHPLLRDETIVPIDLEAGDAWRVVVITGPNTGGKTVALKTAGLLTLMALAGLHVPANADSVVPVVDNVLADIGDEQSIQQSLSTFASHMGNIVRILRTATPRSLVILDEVGAGTDPDEGAALGMSVLARLRDQGALVFASTHHSPLKAFAHTEPGFRNASVEFDPVTLQPLYRVRMGVPGPSNAMVIAERLGLGREVLERARAHLGPERQRLEQLLTDLEAREKELTRETGEMEAQARALEEERERLAALEVQLQAERDEALAGGFEEALTIVRQAREEATRIVARLREQTREGRETQRALDSLRQLRQQLQEEAQAAAEPAREVPEFQAGDTVYIQRLDKTGIVEELGEEGKVKVQCGNVSIWVPAEEVAKVDLAAAPAQRRSLLRVRKSFTTPRELHLIGMTAEEAVSALEKYLDNAALGGISPVRIVHGRGSGALRAAVHQLLSTHPLVHSFRLGEMHEGGDGVTIAALAEIPG